MSLSRRRFGALLATLSGVALTAGCSEQSTDIEVEFDVGDVRVRSPTGRLQRISAAPTVEISWRNAAPASVRITLSVRGPESLLWSSVGTATRAVEAGRGSATVSLSRHDLFDRDSDTKAPSASPFDVDKERQRTRKGKLRLHVTLLDEQENRIAKTTVTDSFDVTVVHALSGTVSSDSTPSWREGPPPDETATTIEAVPVRRVESPRPKPLQRLTFDESPRLGSALNQQSTWSYADLEPRETLSLVSDDEAHRGRALRVALPKGNHKGCITTFPFSNVVGQGLEQLHARYWIRFSDSFEVIKAGGKLPGFGGRYGCGSGGDGPCDGTDGWSARCGFDRPERHGHGEDDEKIQLTYYLYHADMTETSGNNDPWELNDNAGAIERSRWYQLDCYVQMNTPGKNDGVLRGWVDEELAYERTNLKFRAKGYDNIEVKSWLHVVYYGGGWTSPRDQAVYLDEMEFYDRYPEAERPPASR